eukprot:CAMPEP_0179721576 /NCGR_PEP_ID=MMETSP0938-20121108/4552_1 /TAXON_ID=548131 ORGANISM="Ostreococcus mediterraneus, Strain clade-D-RCC1107" /NCGR_SAMPLE_ID=MMETSP0938 /ASSEMBLY_ACC=CAM_ASM_000576 /LENGTH=35 /DNA_ID= /DNA_START= /DNA_END= /DNA_ORIENTATION=
MTFGVALCSTTRKPTARRNLTSVSCVIALTHRTGI